MVTKYYFRIILFFLLLFVNIIQLGSDDSDMTNIEITIREAINYYNEKRIAIIDVRTVQEWETTGVIPGSFLVNMHSADFSENPNFVDEIELTLKSIKNDTKIAFICASGARSEIVANYFKNNNFKNIFHIPEGIVGKSNDGWLHLGFPLQQYDSNEKGYKN